MFAIYLHNPIGSKYALAKKLAISVEELDLILLKSDSCYFPNKPELKPDGTYRQTYRLEDNLKNLLGRVVKNIFHHVLFPTYLQGSIRDKTKSRDYIANAAMHAGKTLLIKEDIKNFFPSIKHNEVLKMWRRLFKLPQEVAEILAKLSTFNGSVAQGSPVSSYIANLIFWDIEPQLVLSLEKLGVTYSRYVDDITVSANRPLSTAEKTHIISLIYGMFAKKGIKPNRRKHFILKNGQKTMTVHGLNVHTATPTLPVKERDRISAAIHECSQRHSTERATIEYKKLYEQTLGRLHRMNRLQPKLSTPLMQKLKKLAPTVLSKA